MVILYHSCFYMLGRKCTQLSKIYVNKKNAPFLHNITKREKMLDNLYVIC